MTPVATKFTQQMKIHLNGGRKFSRLVYKVMADGKDTPITRSKTTGGSPKYLITEDVFFAGHDQFDMLATKGVGLKEWLEAHKGA